MLNDPPDATASPIILIVDDEPDFLRGLSRSIPKEIECSILTATKADSALSIVEGRHVDLVLTDVRMPDKDGIELLQEIKSRDPWITVIIMTGYGTIDIAVEAIRKGAYDFVQKPFKPDHIHRLIRKALEHNSLIRENLRLKNRLNHLNGSETFVGTSSGIRRIVGTIRTVAGLNVTVLMRGESGTGKDLAARYVHLLSPRSNRPMVTVNCPAIPESLLESELFGYTKGAFTGADSPKKGLLEEASGSTLFLDEIGDISPAIQTKLLRVIQEKEIRALGSSQSKVVDVRIIASTNQDLEAKIANKSFREDLFYRLNMVTVFMPPLREIREDIPLLANHFVRQAVSEFDVPPKSISPEAIEHLMDRKWPGNVRQLRNAVQRAMIFSRGPVLEVADFVWDDQWSRESIPETSGVLPFREAREKMLETFTVDYLVDVLQRTRGNVSAAARESGLERQHVQKLMRKYGIQAESFRERGND